MQEESQEPKIDFTYSGEKKLDLGFGFGTAKPADARDAAKQLSWERMRKAGTPFACLVPARYLEDFGVMEKAR